MLISSLQHVREAISSFAASQHGLQDDDENVDILSAVEYCERLFPRLYLQTLTVSVLLERTSGKLGAGMFYSQDEMLKDLSACFLALRHPLKGIFARLFAVATCGPYLSTCSLEAGLDFLLEAFEDVHELWTRMDNPADLIDLIIIPLRAIVEYYPGLDGQLFASHVLPRVLPKLSDGLFEQYMKAFPAIYHAASLPDVLYVAGAKHLEALLETILADENTSLSMTWRHSRQLLHKSQLFSAESDLIRVIAKFLVHLRPNPQPGILDEMFDLLDSQITDKSNLSWRSLLAELVQEAEDIGMLLASPAFMRCLCRNTLVDLKSSVHLVKRWIELGGSYKEAVASCISSIFSKTVIEEHERAFLDQVSDIADLNPIGKEEQLFDMMLDRMINCAEDLSLCFYARSLSSKMMMHSSSQTKFEAFRDSTMDPLDTGSEELQMFFGPDAQAYQFVLVMLDNASANCKDDSLLYSHLSHAIITTEKAFTSSRLHHKAISAIIQELKLHEQVLRSQDLEVLLGNLFKIAGRQLDAGYRTESQVNLLSMLTTRKLASELALEGLARCAQSVRSLTRDKTSYGLALMQTAIALFQQHPEDLARLSEQLNNLFWELREACSFEMQPSYNAVWASWSDVMPKMGQIESPLELQISSSEAESNCEEPQHQEAVESSMLSTALANISLDEDSIY